MENILTARARLRQIFALYDVYIIPALKFFTALFVLFGINSMIGYRAILARWTIIVIIALVCALFPWDAITVVAAIYAVLHLLALSWETAALACAFLVLMGILHYLFIPECSLAIVLVPVAFMFKVPYLVPMIIGLVGGAASFIPVGLGVFFYYFMQCVQRNANVLSESAVDSDILGRFTVLLESLKGNKLMLLSILAFCIVTALIYGIRKLSIDYAHMIAIIAGGIINMLVFLAGGFALNITVPYLSVIMGTLASLVLAGVVQFCILAVDYSRTEYLQFEDDDYVYYVKAVPKMNMTESNRRLKEINAHDKSVSEDGEVEQAINILDILDAEEASSIKKPENKELKDRTMTGPIGVDTDHDSSEQAGK